MGHLKEFLSFASMTEKQRLHREIAELRTAIEVERSALRMNPNDREAQFFLRAKENLMRDLERRFVHHQAAGP